MSPTSCPACGTRLDLAVAPLVQSAPSRPVVGPERVEWLRALQPGTYRSRDLWGWYHSLPNNPPLSPHQLGRLLGRLGYRSRRTKHTRLWEITDQAKSADLGAAGQAN